MSDNIKVVVKVRPLITREIEEKLPYQWRIKNNSLYQLDQNGKEFGSSFTFGKKQKILNFTASYFTISMVMLYKMTWN